MAVGRRIIAKPQSIDEAARTAVAAVGALAPGLFDGVLVAPKGGVRSRVVESRCGSSACPARTSRAISSSDEWRGKAGGYAIQGRAEVFVRSFNGSYSGVIGLPLYETINLLQGAGYPVYYTWMSAAAAA